MIPPARLSGWTALVVALTCAAPEPHARLQEAPEASGTDGFVRTFGGPAFERGVHLSETRDGGYVVVGVTASEGAGGEDVYLLKTDAEGNSLWSRTYGGAEDDNGWCVHELSDGFIVAGFTKSVGAGGFDFYLVRTDAKGELVWERTFGGAGDDRCWSLALTSDGGFVLAGETESEGAGEADVWLVKTDEHGELSWSRTFGGPKSDRCFSVVEAPDGGFVLAGQTYSEGAGDRDAQVIKTGPDGALRWSRTFGGEESDVAHCVARTADGDYLATGYTTSFGEGGDDPYLVLLDAQGETVWDRVIDLEHGVHTLTGEQAADGGFYLAGFNDRSGLGPSTAVVVKTDAEGELEWQRAVLPDGAAQAMGYTVRATADGGCVFTGLATLEAGSPRDLLLVKLPAHEPD